VRSNIANAHLIDLLREPFRQHKRRFFAGFTDEVSLRVSVGLLAIPIAYFDRILCCVSQPNNTQTHPGSIHRAAVKGIYLYRVPIAALIVPQREEPTVILNHP